MSEKQKWFVVVLFAAAMAWVESAVVVYLRTLIDRLIPYQPEPLPLFTGLGHIELGREAATLVMLATVGWLAGRTRRDKIAYAAIAFGTWDIFYYIYLVPMSGWPRSLSDWDILFLLPLPWWGPVLAPVSIALLCVIGGTLITQRDLFPRPSSWLAAFLGAIIALYTFMADVIRVAAQGERAIRSVLPTQFEWALFIAAFALMGLPIVEMILSCHPEERFFATKDLVIRLCVNDQ
jgi:hypothetical protein